MNILHILKKNRETFYNYASGIQTPVLKLNLLKLTLVLILAGFFPLIKNDFYNVIITIYAILIGFSFSILFFLLSINFYDVSSEKILENKEKKRRLNKLLEELFYNVSYFNIVALGLILISLAGYIPNGVAPWIIDLYNLFVTQTKYHVLCTKSLAALQLILAAAFYGFLVESIYTLLRTVERVFYFFQERLQLR